ncbi:MAG: hypothetical protein RIC29_09760 [Rhodospirillaceae bacterium]
MSRGLFAFILSGAIAALIAAVVFGPNWTGLLSTSDTAVEDSSFTPAEIEKMIADWPIALAEVDTALVEYRKIGGSRAGERAIRRGVQANVFQRQQWPNGRGEYLISYFFMLRNSILKYSDQHSALGYFMEHYEQNDAVSPELRELQISQIQTMLNQIDDAPDLLEYPPGDVELMVRYFDRFHEMLVSYGRPSGYTTSSQTSR